jgi:hypothetical protein
LPASIRIKTFLQLRHEIPVFVRQIPRSQKLDTQHALPPGKSFAAVQGQGDGFHPGFFCSGFDGDGWVDLLAQFDRFENRALVLLLELTSAKTCGD